MSTDLSALIVDRRPEKIEALIGVLEKEFQYVSSESVASMHSALECQSTSNFQVCFISEQFSLKELGGFFNDMKSIGKDKSCVFIQLRDKIADGENRSALQAAGFTTMITSEGTPNDRSELRKAMHALLHAREVQVRSHNLEEVAKVALKAIDRLATDRKRGFARPVPPGYRNLIEFQSNFDAQLLPDYFEMLEKQTQSALPIRITAIDMPDKVLKRQLPKLEKNRYIGASHRVWEKLKRKHGKKEESAAEPAKADTTPPAKPEDPTS